MVKQIVFLVLSAMTMEACSTEQNTMEQVRMSDVVSFGLYIFLFCNRKSSRIL